MNLFGESEDECANIAAADNDNDKTQYARLGRYAEFLVCADITMNGYFAQHIDAAGFDVLMVVGHKSYRVQVKSSGVIDNGFAVWRSRIASNSERGSLMRRRVIDRRDADILALYHRDLATMTYAPVLPTSGSFIRMPVSQVRTTPSATTLELAINGADDTAPARDAVFVDVPTS